MLQSRRNWLLATAGVLATPLLAQEKPPPLRLGFSLYGMKNLPLKEALTICANIGYDGVELALMPGYPAEPKLFNAERRREIKDLLNKHRLQLHGMMLNINEPGDERTHQSNLDQIRRAAELSQDITDQPALIETILGGKPTEWAERKSKLVERLKSWAKVAAEHRVTLAIKPHVSNSLHTPDDALWLIREVGSASIKLAYDFSHYQLQGLQLESTLKALLPHTVFIHVKDSQGEASKYTFLLPGQGTTDYKKYAELLNTGKYNGPVVVEVSGLISNKPGYDATAAAKASYTHLARAMGRS